MMSILAAEGPNGAWLPADVLEFAWSAAAFGVVFIALILKVLPMIRKVLAARSEGIRKEIEDAKRARVNAEAELSELRNKLGSAEDEKQRLALEGQNTAKQVKADLIARADEDAATARTRANAELAASSGQATADIQAVIADQATTATESVVKANLDDQTHADLIDRYIQQVSGS